MPLGMGHMAHSMHRRQSRGQHVVAQPAAVPVQLQRLEPSSAGAT